MYLKEFKVHSYYLYGSRQACINTWTRGLKLQKARRMHCVPISDQIQAGTHKWLQVVACLKARGWDESSSAFPEMLNEIRHLKG